MSDPYWERQKARDGTWTGSSENMSEWAAISTENLIKSNLAGLQNNESGSSGYSGGFGGAPLGHPYRAKSRRPGFFTSLYIGHVQTAPFRVKALISLIGAALAASAAMLGGVVDTAQLLGAAVVGTFGIHVVLALAAVFADLILAIARVAIVLAAALGLIYAVLFAANGFRPLESTSNSSAAERACSAWASNRCNAMINYGASTACGRAQRAMGAYDCVYHRPL